MASPSDADRPSHELDTGFVPAVARATELFFGLVPAALQPIVPVRYPSGHPTIIPIQMARAEDTPDDIELLAALRARRPDAFTLLLKREQDAVWRLMMRLTRDAAMAEDLCQEAFLRVYQRLDQFRGDSRLSTWVLRVAFNIGLRYLERQRTAGQTVSDPELLADLEDEAPSVLQRMLEQERQAFLSDALARMPALPRALLGFYYADAMPLNEIADSTGLPIGTIKSHLFRARQWLREQSDSHFGATYVP